MSLQNSLERQGLDVFRIVEGLQSICFDDACWAYVQGAAIARTGSWTRPEDIACASGEGLLAFCIPLRGRPPQGGPGARQAGRHCCSEETGCFAFLAGHESFAAAEGAFGIVHSRQQESGSRPLKVHPERPGQGMTPTSSPGSTASPTCHGLRLRHRKSSTWSAPGPSPTPAGRGPVQRRRLGGRGRGHQVREKVSVHHRQLHQMTATTTRGRTYKKWTGTTEALFLRGVRRRHGRKVHPTTTVPTGLIRPDDIMGRMHCDAHSQVPPRSAQWNDGFLGMGNNPWSERPWPWPWRFLKQLQN